jgi:hypothetical protein
MSALNRREVLQFMGFGAAAVGSGAAVLFPREADAALPEDLAEDETILDMSSAQAAWALVAPFTAGSAIAGMRLVGVSGVTTTGTVNVRFEKADTSRFTVRICRRDPSPTAPAPVAHTEHYDLFLANGGKGRKRTDEAEGVTAMCLAQVVERNELVTAPLAVGTMRERWRRLARR